MWNIWLAILNTQGLVENMNGNLVEARLCEHACNWQFISLFKYVIGNLGEPGLVEHASQS